MYCAILLVVLGSILIRGHYEQSPCPNVFEYKSDSTGSYGLIHVGFLGSVSTITVRANFTIAARLLTNYVGRLAPIGDNPYILDDFNHGMPIDYRVDFPTTSPLPKLTALSVNNNVLCYGPGDIPGPNQYVTTTSLQHTLFLKGQGSNFLGNNGYYNHYDQPYSKPYDDPDLSGYYRPNGINGQTQIYTYGGDENQQGWNSVNNPTNEHRVTQPPQRQPEPQYYPEVITQAPRPATIRPPSPQWSRPTQNFGTDQSCGIISGGNEQPLIYNGQSYNRGDWPWLVAIYKRKNGSLNFICAGTLVSGRHVITAAHCMRRKNVVTSRKDIVVKVGVYNLEDWSDDVTVTRTLVAAYIHDSYDDSILANDILLLTMDRTVQFSNYIRPACLWTGNADLSRVVGDSGVVAGWGQSEDGPAGHGEPKMVRVPIVSTAVCRASRPEFHKLTSSKTLCAGDKTGTGPCSGDSGGGLYLLEGGRWRLRGIVSLSLKPDNGDRTCNLNEYIIFTDSAQYTDWIRTVMSY
ncbi:serine protease gd-like isoform X2 [Hyposmocoma kahamanoa]|uniref:serine protease gd-like isoform X2 n=1 Tax=Hyposmocoma kahamanoa TaxID=1477025 RepID=UPI000E6D69B8|nr:serine protease gd-like isoform X2 [Hyposmocoma kahamanoa]